MLTKRQQVIALLEHRSILRPVDLVAFGLPKDYLFQLAQEGIVQRLGRGLYQLPDAPNSEWRAYVEVQQRAPSAVFCLLSALAFHRIAASAPPDFWLAIANRGWRPRLTGVTVQTCYMSKKSLHYGIETHEVEGVELRITSPAKTVADCFKYRRRVGIDVAIEALKSGWQQRKFKIGELMACAEKCRITNVIKPYAECFCAHGPKDFGEVRTLN